jgi:protein-S-isoprenylcysteine O-methyltransferase Ste14
MFSEILQPFQTFAGCVRLIVALCTVSVLTGVFANFMLAKENHAVQNRRKSFVATGSMLAFFAGFYLLVRFRVGAHEIPQLFYPTIIFGLVLLLLGTAINIAGRFALGKNWGNQVIIYQDHQFITGGVYRIVRHPLYAGLIWMLTGAALVFQNWLALGATIFIFLPAMFYRAKLEEKFLVGQFPTYAEYRSRVGMFFPISLQPELTEVPSSAFAFCRISLTALLWLAFALNNVWPVVAVFAILALSVILKVQRSPMVQLYQQTVLRIFPTKHFALLDVPAMRFAHGMGAVMSLAVVLAMLASPQVGWYCLLIFCILKTTAAIGFCPASKLFVCMRKGGCCALTRFAN